MLKAYETLMLWLMSIYCISYILSWDLIHYLRVIVLGIHDVICAEDLLLLYGVHVFVSILTKP